MTILNLTPHAITLRAPDGSDTTIPPSGTVARVQMTEGRVETIRGFPCLVATSPTYDAIDGLPGPVPGTIYVVSGRVLTALAGQGRTDVYGPGTGPTDGAIRDDVGRIIAVTRIVQAPS